MWGLLFWLVLVFLQIHVNVLFAVVTIILVVKAIIMVVGVIIA